MSTDSITDIKSMHKCLNNQVPQWPVGSSRGFWLSNMGCIYGEPSGALLQILIWAFAVCGINMWNPLPTELKMDG